MALCIALHPFTMVASATTSAPEETLLISELQVRETDSSDELIEIFNPLDIFVELSNFKLQYASATTDVYDPNANLTTLVELQGYLAPRSYIYFVNEDFPDPLASGSFKANLANTSGHVLITNDNETKIYDLIGWGAAISAETAPVVVHDVGQSLQRKQVVEEPAQPLSTNDTSETVDSENISTTDTPIDSTSEIDDSISGPITTPEELVDTDDNSQDFVSGTPDPKNTNYESPDTEQNQDTNTVNQEELESTPPINPDAFYEGVVPIGINELLPDPEKPVTDAEGEFIELYNPNPFEVDMSDIVLQTGSTFSRQTSLDGLVLAPLSYSVVYSGQYNFSLSNSGSSARLVLPSGLVWGQEVIYPKATAGEAYALFGSEWRWTTRLTPNAENVYVARTTVVKSASKKRTTSKSRASTTVNPAKFNLFKPLIITELLPDPNKPVTDAEGEFIELYNPNDQAVDLEGLILETGSNFTYNFTFGKNTRIGPGEYLALFSKDSKLTLSNSGGAVRMLLPNGQQWGDTVTYDEAETGESYANIDGNWQWTDQPTPNTPNVVRQVEPVQAEEAGSQTGGFSDAYQPPPEIPTSFGSWLMVGGLGVSALLYSGYEYRKDIANTVWKYRRNRHARG